MIGQAAIIARLKAAGFAHVEGLLEFAGLDEAPRMSPALYVVAERGTGAPNRMGSGVVDQKITETFSVVVVVQATRLASGASDALKEHCDAVERALIGWVHPEASGPCEYASARLLSAEGHRVAWAISLSVSRHFRGVSQ